MSASTYDASSTAMQRPASRKSSAASFSPSAPPCVSRMFFAETHPGAMPSDFIHAASHSRSGA